VPEAVASALAGDLAFVRDPFEEAEDYGEDRAELQRCAATPQGLNQVGRPRARLVAYFLPDALH
jgi:hypothetical protein